MAPDWTRRRLLQASLGTALAGLAPAVRAGPAVTPTQPEGPFYPRIHQRLADQDRDLVRIGAAGDTADGEVLHLAGRILDADGVPLPEAVVEIWQCDARGRYRHPRDRGDARDPFFQGFGRTRTDGEGWYGFRTIRPVPYPGRTPHVHFKVHLADRPHALTTQMYIAGDPRNDRDGLYRRLGPAARRAVSATLKQGPDGELAAWFDLVVSRS